LGGEVTGYFPEEGVATDGYIELLKEQLAEAFRDGCIKSASIMHLQSIVRQRDEQLANAQSEAKFAREHLERAREQLAEMGKRVLPLHPKDIERALMTLNSAIKGEKCIWPENIVELRNWLKALASLPGGAV
jgi:hypothetical protein